MSAGGLPHPDCPRVDIPIRPLALCTGAACLIVTGAAQAQTFVCHAADATYDVTLHSPDRASVRTHFAPPLDHKRMEFDLLAAPTGSGFRYANDFAELHGKGQQANFTIDERQLACDMAGGGATPAETADEPMHLRATGQSLGGHLRAGPGTEFASVDVLPEGAPVGIVGNAGVRFNGYDWFEIVIGDSVGYQWGGILCSENQHVAGLYHQCGVPPAAAEPGGWMAFAIDWRGAVGHGAAPTPREAENFALTHCGNASCTVVAATEARCQALADRQQGAYVYGIGDGGDLAMAEGRALEQCVSASGAQCGISYSYCR